MNTIQRIRLALFVLFAIATVAVPLSLIVHYETVRREGKVHKFRIAPVDPVDAFRGRYVTLSFADNTLKSGSSSELPHDYYNSRDPLVHIRLKQDADGFSVPAELLESAAKMGDFPGDVIIIDKHRERYIAEDTATKSPSSRLVLDYPFNRYYLPENIAPEAERIYQAALRWTPNATVIPAVRNANYATVRVLNGAAVLDELYINGLPVREAVRKAAADSSH
jgi:uncharacterized membrane-anchored protein